MIDKTDKSAQNELKRKYGDQIIEHETVAWKEKYLAPPPPRSICRVSCIET